MRTSEHWQLLERIQNVYVDVYMSYPPYKHPFGEQKRKISSKKHAA